MKIKIVLLSLIAVLAAGCAEMNAYSKPKPAAKWQNPANWNQIRVGMSESQVRLYLGRPPYMGEYYESDYQNWYYPNSKGGVVQMNAHGRVVAFRSPRFVEIYSAKSH
jgi:outer membrane protein assembly factor BamE (lipoprotein component of BamABCDE complex)